MNVDILLKQVNALIVHTPSFLRYTLKFIIRIYICGPIIWVKEHVRCLWYKSIDYSIVVYVCPTPMCFYRTFV